jgi:hypothetical protein
MGFVNLLGVFSYKFVANGGGIIRAALGTTSLSAVTNLIETAILSSCSSTPTGIYRLLWAGVFYISS